MFLTDPLLRDLVFRDVGVYPDVVGTNPVPVGKGRMTCATHTFYSLRVTGTH